MYSPYKFNKKQLQAVIDIGFPVIRQVMAVTGANGVAVTGSSGIALMSALVLHDFDVVQVRKRDEDSHGSQVEWDDSRIRPDRLVFVDDFIASGSTIRRAAEDLEYRRFQIVGAVAVIDCGSPKYRYHNLGYGLRLQDGEVFIPYWRQQYDARLPD